MDIKNKIKIIGKYEIFEIKNNSSKKIDEFNNIITNLLLDELIGSLMGYNPNLEIKYIGLGTDNTAVAATDTLLGTEYCRSLLIDKNLTIPPTYGEIVVDFYLTSSEGNTTIEELGIFCGNNATSTADTGILISHVLWNYTKTSAVELLIRYTATIT